MQGFSSWSSAVYRALLKPVPKMQEHNGISMINTCSALLTNLSCNPQAPSRTLQTRYHLWQQCQAEENRRIRNQALTLISEPQLLLSTFDLESQHNTRKTTPTCYLSLPRPKPLNPGSPAQQKHSFFPPQAQGNRELDSSNRIPNSLNPQPSALKLWVCGTKP